MFKRVIFYVADSQVYHIVPGGEQDFDRNRTLCNWNYRSVERPNPYYDAKLGVYYFEEEAETVRNKRLCKRCAKRLDHCPQVPFNSFDVR